MNRRNVIRREKNGSDNYRLFSVFTIVYFETYINYTVENEILVGKNSEDQCW